jgi:alanyl-tRNA synthetase
MNTERLYYADSYLTHFTAHVVARGERGGRPAIALDQSAFYPEGGGQPADYGMLNSVPVLDVQSDDGLVWHVLAEPLEGDVAHGEIDWTRRLDHMQQHHGQHLLSAALERLYGFRTVSFHLGAAGATIDLDTATLDPDQLIAAEELVNEIIWEDRPILARFVTPEELATLPLRKPPTVDGPVRVVSVPDFDHSACGGTHPRSTGCVGTLHIRRWERRGETARVEFVCGRRALHDYRAKDALVARFAADFSTGVDDLPSAVERLRVAEERARKQLEKVGAQLIAYEAQDYVQSAETAGSARVVRRIFDGRSIDDVRALAQAIAGAGCAALLGTRGERAQVVFARAEGLPVDCGALLRAALAPLGGRGGGQPSLAQGGVPDPAALQAVIDSAFDALAMRD